VSLVWFSKIQEQIDARVLRERVLICLSAIAVIFMLWSLTVQAIIDKKMLSVRAQLEALAKQQMATQTQIAAATQNLLNDPNRQKTTQITQLQNDIEQLESQFNKAAKVLIKADQLPRALEDVLRKAQAISLVSVKTLPVQELQFIPTQVVNVASLPGKNDASSIGVYKHGVELRVAGSYAQIRQLLIDLERLPWRFYWQDLTYAVKTYPDAEMTLRVYTLSSEEGFWGV